VEFRTKARNFLGTYDILRDACEGLNRPFWMVVVSAWSVAMSWTGT
jgi:hypothetical protein